MNIFQQVFAQVGNKNEKNSDESDNMMPNLKSKFQTTSSIQRSSRNPLQAKNQNVLNTQKIDKEMVNKNPSMKYSQNFRQANKTKKQENINYMETLHEIKKKVYDMEHKILIKQNEIKKMKENNERLKIRNQEMENIIDKMNVSANETSKKFRKLQEDFVEENDERNKYWEFRYLELKIKVDSLKSDSNNNQ